VWLAYLIGNGTISHHHFREFSGSGQASGSSIRPPSSEPRGSVGEVGIDAGARFLVLDLRVMSYVSFF